MSEINKKKRGRPKINGEIRDTQIHCMISKSEYEFIQNAIKASGKTMSEMTRIGLMRVAAEEIQNSYKNDI